jgi:hypothetical protein
MKKHNPKKHTWKRELRFATSRRFWREHALETRLCAEFLLERWEAALAAEEPMRGFFAPKFVRMMYGYALENLVKGLLLSGPNSGKYINEKTKRISFRKGGHDLEHLFEEQDIIVSDVEEFCLKVWSTSATWYGKYPFPLSEDGVVDERSPQVVSPRGFLSSLSTQLKTMGPLSIAALKDLARRVFLDCQSQALVRRAQKEWAKEFERMADDGGAIKPLFRMSLGEVLRQGITRHEREVFPQLFDRLAALYNDEPRAS